MPRKISKSDTLDKEQEARDKAWLASQKESEHFAVGTFVLCDGERYEIVGRLGRTLTVIDSAGIPMFLNPIALSKER